MKLEGHPGLYRQYDGGMIWLKYYRNGRCFRESSGTTEVAKAQRLLNRRKGELEAGTFVEPNARRVKVDELVADLLAWYRNTAHKAEFADASEQRWNDHLAQFFSGMRAEQVTTGTIRRYRERRAEEKKPRPSPTTVNRELQVLRKAFRLAAKANPPKVRFVPPFEMSDEKHNARKTYATTEMLDKLRTAASKEGLWARFFLEMTYTIGWRKSEVLGLTVGNVHLAESYIRIEETKNGDPREAALTANLKTLVTPLVLGRKSEDPLFPIKDVRCAWRRICKAAGFKAGRDGLVIHDGRRTAPRRQRAAGVPQSVSMAQMGWKSDAMYRRYGIVDRGDMLAALERVEQFEQGGSSKPSRKTPPDSHGHNFGHNEPVGSA